MPTESEPTTNQESDDRNVGPVIVGVDGSESAARAMAVAAGLARATGAELVVVHAAGLMTMIDGRWVPVEGHWDDLERQLDEVWCAPLRDETDVEWRSELQFGPAADLLIERADQLGASFVVIGSRGIREMPEYVLGSTSHHVVHRCRRPVVVVPPGAAEPVDSA